MAEQDELIQSDLRPPALQIRDKKLLVFLSIVCELYARATPVSRQVQAVDVASVM